MFKTILAQFWNEEDGASAIEYGLLAALIAVFIATNIGLVGTELNTVFGQVKDALKP